MTVAAAERANKSDEAILDQLQTRRVDMLKAATMDQVSPAPSQHCTATAHLGRRSSCAHPATRPPSFSSFLFVAFSCAGPCHPSSQVELPKRDGNGAQPMDTDGDENEDPVGKDDDAVAALDYRSVCCYHIAAITQYLQEDW